jgi:hypothetical protein
MNKVPTEAYSSDSLYTLALIYILLKATWMTEGYYMYTSLSFHERDTFLEYVSLRQNLFERYRTSSYFRGNN